MLGLFNFQREALEDGTFKSYKNIEYKNKEYKNIKIKKKHPTACVTVTS